MPFQRGGKDHDSVQRKVAIEKTQFSSSLFNSILQFHSSTTQLKL